ncbi:hypothetical protein ACQ4PT_040497 [Festuca glaucescens]
MDMLSRSLQSMGSPDVSVYFSGGSSRNRSGAESDDEEALRWAALERLPSFERLRTGILRSERRRGPGVEVDVRMLELTQRQAFVENVFKVAEEDNARFLKKLRARIDHAGIQIPTAEVRFRSLSVEAECHVGDRMLPTLTNAALDAVDSMLGLVGVSLGKTKTLHILKNVSGVVRPSRMTLLLGPPSSGKTTLLLALAGKLDPGLRVSGEVTYNGYGLDEFVPQKTAAYISQNDVHAGEMTVKETLDFSARCQGVGQRYELLQELMKKERQLGIYPDPEVDLFMKATSVEGGTLQTDYILRILGLDMCADVMVGDEMRTGISGGQKKRLTTGEMLVGPTKVLFMDEISTGLDSSTTFQVVRCIQQIVHLGEATVLVSLLQPAPEIFDLFDDVLLLSEGQIVYQGPREYVLEFFEKCGFRCPERKGAADFLQEVTSKKDQEQYWIRDEKPYRYVSVPEFVAKFKKFHMGKSLKKQLSVPFNKRKIHKSALAFSQQSVPALELLKTSFAKEWLLMKRNSFIYVFKIVQTADGRPLGVAVLENSGVFTNNEWYWIGTGALLGFTVLFNVLFTISLMILNPVGKPQAILPEETDKSTENVHEQKRETHVTQRNTVPTIESASQNSMITLDKVLEQLRGHSPDSSKRSYANTAARDAPGKGMVLPFEPLSMSFNEINYYVDMPAEMKTQGVTADKLQLLSGISGAFRPGVLTALMGVSGAGKTTLMDVLSGRKTGGYIEGEVYISGYPKNQATFARMSGYCEQNDIHSPQITVRESLLFSAFLRLPKEVTDREKKAFVDEVMELIELTGLKDAIVGLPGVSGLSTEQRKRLTIAVELVANPSIIFMDEPTSGLDARAAAIVMRTVRNTVNTGRTVVCTIHQPSIDIFEAFDELLLLKRGGQVIYSGPLGRNSHKVVEYFQEIPGVPKIVEKCNPATWMLDASSAAAEVRLNIDFAEHYKSSTMYQNSSADVLVIVGSMYAAVMFVGCENCITVQPLIAVERTVFYRERAAGMYSAVPYALSQVVVEIPYVFVESVAYTVIVYPMMSFQWTLAKFLWFFYVSFLTFLYFTYYGMMTVSISPNGQVASIFAAAFYSFFNLFSGFFVARSKIPKWWIWYYWLCPVAWTVYGLVVSQYGDVDDMIKVPGQPDQQVGQFIKSYFGYDQDFMGVVAAVLAGFTVFFAMIYAYCIKAFNFQQR